MKTLAAALLLFISGRTVSQELIYATIAGGDLYSFDLSDCTREFIGSTGQGFGDIAFTPNGELWGIVGAQLYHIDPTTANATLIGFTGLKSVSLAALNDSTLLTEFETNLYAVNTTSASSTFIDAIGFQAAGDLTWYDDDLYMVTSFGQIIKIVLNSSNTGILSVTAIGSDIPVCEGAVTASFPDNYNSIAGFNGHDLIKICQIDGSIQMLCPELNIGGTPGAASIRLPTQEPQPGSCTPPTGIDPVRMDHLFTVFPNPACNTLHIQVEYSQKSTVHSIPPLKHVIFAMIHCAFCGHENKNKLGRAFVGLA